MRCPRCNSELREVFGRQILTHHFVCDDCWSAWHIESAFGRARGIDEIGSDSEVDDFPQPHFDPVLLMQKKRKRETLDPWRRGRVRQRAPYFRRGPFLAPKKAPPSLPL